MPIRTLIDTLRAEAHGSEWLEFKCNNDQPQLIGEYLSALSNSACLCGKTHGYLVFGIEDKTHDVVGTSLQPHRAKGKGNEGLEPWLARWECQNFMTNASLRERFGIKESNYPMASKVIKEALDAGMIKAADPNNLSNRDRKYIPEWG